MTLTQISDKEREAIKQLRAKISEIVKDEYYLSDGNLYNWLSYKNFKVDKAEKAIQKNLKWRLDNKIDSIQSESFGEYFESLIYYEDAVDKEGRPVICSYVSQVDPKEALEIYCADKDKAERHSLQRAEYFFDKIKKAHAQTNGKVNSCVAIVDCKGLKLKPFMSKLIELVPRGGALAKTVEKNYPGLMEKTYVLNAPNKVHTLFTMIKPFLKAETTKRIKIFNKKDEKWRDVITSEISPDQIQKRYGGSLPDEPERLITLKK